MTTIGSHFKKNEKVKYRNRTVVSGVSVVSGIVHDPTLTTLTTVLFVKTHI